LSAIDAFDQGLALVPNDPALLTNRGQAFMHIGDEAAFEKAKADFDRALDINPDLIAGYFNRGAYYMRTGNLAAAVDDFTSVLDIDPAQPAAHFNRAMAYRDMGEVDKAIDDLVLVLAFRPDEELEAQAKAMLEELQTQQVGEADTPSAAATDSPNAE
jgi:tetratricopeptide (TPR) repeat protein